MIQYNEYYPFGLQTSTSWTRENTKDNNYLYNAANELNKTSGWYEMFYRGYDPAIGRMLQVDPYAPMYASFTTYNYAVNNPVMMNDPSGGQASESHNYGISRMGQERYDKINSMDNPNYFSMWSESIGQGYGWDDFSGGTRRSDGGMLPTNEQKSALIDAYLSGELFISGEYYAIPNYELLWTEGNKYYLRQLESTWIEIGSSNRQSESSRCSSCGIFGAEALYNWGLREFYYGPQVRGLKMYENGSLAERMLGSRARNEILLKTRRMSTPFYRTLAELQKPASSLKINPNGRFWVPNSGTMWTMRGVGAAGGVMLGYGLYQSYNNITTASDPTAAAINEGFSWAGALAGGLAGAKGGAAIGSFFGPVGTVVGGFVGGLAGSVIGGNVGYAVGSEITGY